MRKVTELEEMLLEAKVGDTLVMQRNANEGTGEEKGFIVYSSELNLYNVAMFEDESFGDSEWVDTSLEELINGWYETWTNSGGMIYLLKGEE